MGSSGSHSVIYIYEYMLCIAGDDFNNTFAIDAVDDARVPFIDVCKEVELDIIKHTAFKRVSSHIHHTKEIISRWKARDGRHRF